jgi:flagellar biosynthesis GTPase FlhF
VGTQIVKPDDQQLQQGLESLKAAANLQIVTAEDCAKGKLLLRDIRSYKKDVHLKLDGFVSDARTALDRARDRLAVWIGPADAIDEVVSRKLEDWTRKEREAAAAEERRINEERRIEAARIAEEQRKAAEAQAALDRKKREKEIAEAQKAGEIKKREADKLRKENEERERLAKEQAAKDAEATKANVQEVKVQPSTPKVSGVRSLVLWKFRVLDARKVHPDFLMPNEVKIGSSVRFTKDKAKSEAEIGGIEVYTEDSI